MAGATNTSDLDGRRPRPEDALPLARHFARQARGREVDLTPAAMHGLTGYAWLGNVGQLNRVIAAAARRTDLIDVQHLPSEVLSDRAHHLPRIRVFERDEILRVVTQPGPRCAVRPRNWA